MQNIGTSKLTQLLKEGFHGYVEFQGSVQCYCNKFDFHHPGHAIFDAAGDFYLHPPDSNLKAYRLIHRTHTQNTDAGNRFSFQFEVADSKKISCSIDRFGDIIMIPITFQEETFLQINPKTIIY